MRIDQGYALPDAILDVPANVAAERIVPQLVT
jgi:hypothetical protein